MWPGAQNPPHLELRLPADDAVLHGLLLFHGETWFDYSDARRERLKVKPIVTGLEISDAGRKLRGLIELFGGFWRAQDFWARSCWREIFCRMSGRGANYDNNLRARIEGAAEKELWKISPPIQPDGVQKAAQRIGQRVLNLVGERLPGIPMAFAEMEKIRASLENNGQQSLAAKEVKYLAGDTMVPHQRLQTDWRISSRLSDPPATFVSISGRKQIPRPDYLRRRLFFCHGAYSMLQVKSREERWLRNQIIDYGFTVLARPKSLTRARNPSAS